jgi:hypothetical protein
MEIYELAQKTFALSTFSTNFRNGIWLLLLPHLHHQAFSQ